MLIDVHLAFIGPSRSLFALWRWAGCARRRPARRINDRAQSSDHRKCARDWVGDSSITASARGVDVVIADIETGTDVTKSADVVDLFSSLGHLDILFLNAGRSYSRSTINATDADWDECIALNLRGSWECASASYARMGASGIYNCIRLHRTGEVCCPLCSVSPRPLCRSECNPRSCPAH